MGTEDSLEREVTLIPLIALGNRNSEKIADVEAFLVHNTRGHNKEQREIDEDSLLGLNLLGGNVRHSL